MCVWVYQCLLRSQVCKYAAVPSQVWDDPQKPPWWVNFSWPYHKKCFGGGEYPWNAKQNQTITRIWSNVILTEFLLCSRFLDPLSKFFRKTKRHYLIRYSASKRNPCSCNVERFAKNRTWINKIRWAKCDIGELGDGRWHNKYPMQNVGHSYSAFATPWKNVDYHIGYT